MFDDVLVVFMHTYSKKQYSTNTVFKKRKRKRIVYVCTKDVSEIRENEQYGIFKRKKKEFQNLLFRLE